MFLKPLSSCVCFHLSITSQRPPLQRTMWPTSVSYVLSGSSVGTVSINSKTLTRIKVSTHLWRGTHILFAASLSHYAASIMSNGGADVNFSTKTSLFSFTVGPVQGWTATVAGCGKKGVKYRFLVFFFHLQRNLNIYECAQCMTYIFKIIYMLLVLDNSGNHYSYFHIKNQYKTWYCLLC